MGGVSVSAEAFKCGDVTTKLFQLHPVTEVHIRDLRPCGSLIMILWYWMLEDSFMLPVTFDLPSYWFDLLDRHPDPTMSGPIYKGYPSENESVFALSDALVKWGRKLAEGPRCD